MGVHGLWELLAPVGRRVSVETLAGKTLAVDASIWMVQFMKAMRDEKGEMVRNAHLLGFFRRICKLLFLRTKPVFVFDGGTPALKRRTVIARRRQRENAQAKVRKTAEKLLLNHLKAMRLKELSNDIKNQRLKHESNTVRQEKTDQMDFVYSDLGGNNVKELNEMLAASKAAEENETLARKELASTMINTTEEECETDEEVILPSINDDVDLAVLAALPQSMQRDILAQLKGKKKEGSVKDVGSQKHEVNDMGMGKGIQFSETGMAGCSSRCDKVTSSDTQEKIDEMLAASIAAAENAKSVNNASTSLGASTTGEEDGDYDEDEEMILPAMHGEVDQAVLASLPPSMQLDLLVQMRERLIAENRQKYQKVKKDPAKFSELQIQAYLKTVAFRREIDVVQKAASGGGVGGVQTSRIASEANREYIFLSSFTGDKQDLTSARTEKNDDSHQKAQETHHAPTFANRNGAGNDSNASSGLASSEPCVSVDESIQTFLDERGRFRVSRSRAMGMRMTRDIQRNLDLMKEIEQQKTYLNKAANIDTVLRADNGSPSESSGINLVGKLQSMDVDLLSESVPNEHSMLDKDTPIEVSFEYDCKNTPVDGVDDIFANLVGGNLGTIFHADDTAAKEQPSYSDTDCDWEEGIVEVKDTVIPGDNKVEWRSSVAEEDNNGESEIEWEEGDCDGAKNTLSCPSESNQKASQGRLEESNLQEAIRKSLESIEDGELKHLSSIDVHSNSDENMLDHGLVRGDNLAFPGPTDLNDEDACLNNKKSMGALTVPTEHSTEQNALHENVDELGKHDCVARYNSQTFHFPGSQSKSSVASISNNPEILFDKPFVLDICPRSEYPISDANVMTKDNIHMVAEKLLNKHRDGKVSFDATEEEKNNCNNESEPLSNSTDNTKYAIPLIESSLKGSTENLNTEPMFALVDNERCFNGESNIKLAKDEVNTSGDFPAYVAEIRLEEEIRILNQECVNLEGEQRRLERNAESVNSELFTECQELLQMFGLPYIIAPMEAEAQCAFLELAKLVDGVVTDDSDVLLFGARSVFKNIFDDRKYVETYFMEDIEKELGLTREKLVRMALLLGSDYTEGVSGIGIVNAIEVVNAFPGEDGLLKFRQWVESPDPTILGRLNDKSGSNSRKKGLDLSAYPQEQNDSLDDNKEIKQAFFAKHRNVSKNWHIPTSFPSETVISAYYSPQVDKSTESFTWGKPDHLVLRKLCWEKFGWTSQKADELLLPVLKEYNKHETQLRLEAFYSFNERFAKIRSKRIKKAVEGIIGNLPSELDDSKSRKSGRGSPAEPGDNKFENLKGTEEGLEGMKKPKVKQSRKRKNNGDTVAKAPSTRRKIIGDPSVVDNVPLSMQTGKEQCDGKPLISNRRGRGRRRDLGAKQGREKESVTSQFCETLSREKESVTSQFCETLSSSSDTDDHGPRMHADISKVPQEVQKSIRSRIPVNYSFDNLEVEDANGSSNPSYQTSLCEEPIEENLSYIHNASGDAATDFSRGKEGNMINCPLNADSSADYLKIGGGFCLDDSEIGYNPNTIDGVNTATEDDTEEFSHCSVMLDETDRDKNSSDIFCRTEIVDKETQDGGTARSVNNEPNDDLLNASKSCGQSEKGRVVPENVNHISGSYIGALSAMPFLRKKRKKY